MNTIIQITESNGAQAVDARELHAFLDSKQHFADWVKARIEKYAFEEGEDFFIELRKTTKGGRPSTEYTITLDMAKELAMLENNDKGKQARQYFIRVEKESRKAYEQMQQLTRLPDEEEMALMYLQSVREKKALQAKVDKLQPLANAAVSLLEIKNSVTMSQAAKLMKFSKGNKTLFKYLRDNGYLFKHKNEPLQQYVDRGWFELKLVPFTTPSGEQRMTTQVYVTPKGLIELHNRLNQAGLIVSQMALL